MSKAIALKCFVIKKEDVGNQWGFTLFELLMILSLFGIVGLTAIPNSVEMLDQFSLDRDYRNTQHLIAQARRLAILTKQDVRIGYTATSIHYDVGDDGSIEKTYEMPGGSSWVGTPRSFVFNGFGFVEKSPPVYVMTLQGASAREFTISMHWNGTMRTTH